MRGLGRRRTVPVDTSERSTLVSTTTAIVIITAVTILGFYLLAGYIVHKTGGTAGIADIGRAVAAIVAAITHRP